MSQEDVLYLKSHQIELETDYSILTLETRRSEDLSYDDFFCNFMAQNKPILIQNVSNDWMCSKKWINEEQHINYEYLREHYGDMNVPVANCDDISFNSQNKTEMKLSKYMDYLQNSLRSEKLYLKDWHLKRSLPEDLFYTVPKIFASDWLNEHAIDNNEDDFMFVYIGPSESWTPMHVDVYNSYSWSVNITGRKKWLLFPPGEESMIYDVFGNLPLLFKPEENRSVRYLEVIQEKGDALFVPSGWHHQVINLVDTVSVNHNWINGCNLHFVWNALLKSLHDVEKEIIDLKESPEYTEQCQIILKSLFGMDIESFYRLLHFVGAKRITEYKNKSSLKFNRYILSEKHILFDLNTIQKTIECVIHNPLTQKLSFKTNIQNELQEVLLSLKYILAK